VRRRRQQPALFSVLCLSLFAASALTHLATYHR
jgi:hypothetical protein